MIEILIKVLVWRHFSINHCSFRELRDDKAIFWFLELFMYLNAPLGLRNVAIEINNQILFDLASIVNYFVNHWLLRGCLMHMRTN